MSCCSTSFLTLLWAISRFTLTIIDPLYTLTPTHCRAIRDTFIFYFNLIFVLIDSVSEATIDTSHLLCNICIAFGTPCCVNGHEMHPKLLPRKIKGIARSSKYPKVIHHLTCLAFLLPKVCSWVGYVCLVSLAMEYYQINSSYQWWQLFFLSAGLQSFAMIATFECIYMLVNNSLIINKKRQ